MLATIKHNSTGNLVKVAKYLSGFSERGKANEKFDADFVAFICTWQSKHGLKADGVIGPSTWTKLAENAPTCSTAKNRTSAATCAVQLMVGGLTADGVFGTKTKNAVAAYQTAKGLTADGICGLKTWAALIGVAKASTDTSTASGTGTGAGQTVSDGKTLNNCVHYLQWDAKWKNVKYSTHTSSQTIGNSGCGPSAMAQIMATFIDKAITPVEMAALAQANGFRTYSSGTSWDFYEFVFKKYKGFSKFVKTSSIATLKAALADGALAVCSMNSNDGGYWTKSGHFITAIGFDASGYIYANDPNKQECPRKQKQDKFKSCLKQAFIFWPEAKENIEPYILDVDVDLQSINSRKDELIAPPVPEVEVELREDGSMIYQPVSDDGRVLAIIDISKHDGDIDFETLKPSVSLVIARASIGSDKDERFEEYAKEMNRLGIPFGVYCYSYAKDIVKAVDEATKLRYYANAYNPLFYVMDAEEECVTTGAIKVFAGTLRSFGERVGAYVAHHRYKAYQFDTVRDKFDFVWIPRYAGNDAGEPTGKRPDYKCDLWQYTENGTIPGIKGTVDKNVITGDGHTLAWFLGGE